ncbi:MAG TPA: DNA polymerase III subunit beta [Actinomycetota bacterium]|nr:DNA polymerase III subunit beta [Actinomycetota bacterium]
MKFRCERDDILGAVQFASRAISTRATLPVLAGLRIEALEGGQVRVAATDLELTMETAFQAAVDEPGRTIVPGRLFGEMTRSLVAGQVSVAGNEAEVEIGSGRGQFRVKALAPDDYPSLPIEDQAADSTGLESDIDADTLAVALSQVVRSASGDESRQILTGVLWELSENSLTLAATDSYRLGVRDLEVSGGPSETRQVVLPARTLGELERALNGSGKVKTVVKDNLVSFTISNGTEPGMSDAVIGSRFIEGEFPKYRQLLPDTYPNTLTVEKDALLDVTKRVGLLAQNNLPLKLRLGNELEISAHTPDVGEGQEVLDASYEGEPLVIAFNPQFLYDGVSAVQGDSVVMLVGDGLKPAIIKGQGDESFTYLLMPVRLS